ncbi:MAG: DUF3099 domain-containing protein [Propioniciclava sp.]
MGARTRPTLITDARHGATLSTDQRTKRYLWTMAFRVAAFLCAAFTPLPWNLVLVAAAALLPGIAVLLGNARDNRVGTTAPTEDTRAAIGPAPVVPGEIDDSEASR